MRSYTLKMKIGWDGGRISETFLFCQSLMFQLGDVSSRPMSEMATRYLATDVKTTVPRSSLAIVR